MVEKVITFTNANGDYCIRGKMTPQWIARFDGDEDAARQAILDTKMPPDAVDIRVLTDPTFPSSREFRNAWEHAAGHIGVNMSKARVVHVEHINRAKLTLARELLERELLGENVAAERGLLVAINVQGQISSAVNPEVLAQIWPNVLNRFRNG